MNYSNDYSRAAYDTALKRAEKRLKESEVPPEEIDPDVMAEEIAGELEGDIPTDYLAEYISDTMWSPRNNRTIGSTPDLSPEIKRAYLDGEISHEELQEYIETEYLDELDEWWRDHLVKTIARKIDSL